MLSSCYPYASTPVRYKIYRLAMLASPCGINMLSIICHHPPDAVLMVWPSAICCKLLWLSRNVLLNAIDMLMHIQLIRYGYVHTPSYAVNVLWSSRHVLSIWMQSNMRIYRCATCMLCCRRELYYFMQRIAANMLLLRIHVLLVCLCRPTYVIRMWFV